MSQSRVWSSCHLALKCHFRQILPRWRMERKMKNSNGICRNVHCMFKVMFITLVLSIWLKIMLPQLIMTVTAAAWLLALLEWSVVAIAINACICLGFWHCKNVSRVFGLLFSWVQCLHCFIMTQKSSPMERQFLGLKTRPLVKPHRCCTKVERTDE